MGDAIFAVIQGIATDVNGIIAAFTGPGIYLTGTFTVLGVVKLGLSFMSGSMAFVGPLWRFTGINAGVLWALSVWPFLVDLSRGTAKGALALIGLSGFAAMFDLAQDASQRILAEMVGISATSPIGSVIDSFIAAMCALVVLVGLSFPPMLAAIAEVELLLGSAIAPLVLPALALPWLRTIGFGVIQWQVSAVLRIVALGVLSHAIGSSVTAVTQLPTMGETYQFAAVQQLTVLAVFSAMLALSAGALANAMVRGTPGTMGSTSLTNVAGYVVGGLSLLKNSGGRSSDGGSGGGGGGSGGGGTSSRRSGGGSTSSTASGSAFP